MTVRPQYHFRSSERGLLAWNVQRLCRLADKITPCRVLLSRIKEVDTCYWYDLGGGTPTCRNIIEHIKLIEATDLSYPIILDCNGCVMDGMHRVCKAVLNGETHILAVQFDADVTPDFINVNPDDLPYGSPHFE
jgi:hypothetical protein